MNGVYDSAPLLFWLDEAFQTWLSLQVSNERNYRRKVILLEKRLFVSFLVMQISTTMLKDIWSRLHVQTYFETKGHRFSFKNAQKHSQDFQTSIYPYI